MTLLLCITGQVAEVEVNSLGETAACMKCAYFLMDSKTYYQPCSKCLLALQCYFMFTQRTRNPASCIDSLHFGSHAQKHLP